MLVEKVWENRGIPTKATWKVWRGGRGRDRWRSGQFNGFFLVLFCLRSVKSFLSRSYPLFGCLVASLEQSRNYARGLFRKLINSYLYRFILTILSTFIQLGMDLRYLMSNAYINPRSILRFEMPFALTSLCHGGGKAKSGKCPKLQPV